MGYIIFLGFLLISMTILIFLAAFTQSRTDCRKIIWFTPVLAALFLYQLGILLSIITKTSAEAAYNGVRVEQTGAYFLGPLVFFFIADYCKFKIHNGLKAIMMLISLIFLVLLWTTEYHGLMYISFVLSEKKYIGIDIESGPMRFFPHFYSLFLIIISSILITKRLFEWDAKYRRPLILLLLVSFSPAFVNVIYSMNIGGVADSGLELTSIVMSFCCILLWLNIVRWNMFDIISESMKMALSCTKEAFILLDEDNHFLHANDSAKKIFTDLAKMKAYSSMDKIENWPFYIPKTDKNSVQIKFDLGSDRHYVANIDAITDENSKIVGRIILIQDISDVVLYAKHAEEASRAKSNFLALISHEIRTPMNAILGITQMELQNDSPYKNREALDKIYTSSSNLLGIINDILDLSKIEAGKFELNPAEYDVPSIINDTVQLNIVRIGEKPIEFLLDVKGELPSKMIGDELRLKQILTNLLSNAIKYTVQGFVKLSVSHEVNGDDIILRFDIEDTGQGMKPEDVERLFSEYERFNAEANRTIEGTGIGLSITKNLVTLMEGNITVESEFNKGSIFTLTVKQRAVECETIGPEIAERLCNLTFSEGSWKKREQIVCEPMPYGSVLIVDDVDTNLYVAQGLMAPYQLQIKTANSGFEAIEILRDAEVVYDIVFMDHMMPELDGIETTRILRESGYKGTIIALTANALVGNDEMFKLNGLDDFISKPIDMRMLNMILKKWVRDKYPEEAKKYAGAGTVANPSLPTRTKPDDKLLQVFIKDAQKAIKTLRETVPSDIKLFTITAHAMKAALANIGEDEKSAVAGKLEAAGRNGDTEYISENLEKLIKNLEDLIKEYKKEETDDVDVLDDWGFLIEQLVLIKTACENYDEPLASQILNKLMEIKWSNETLTKLDEIHDTLYFESDFEKVVEQTNLLITLDRTNVLS